MLNKNGMSHLVIDLFNYTGTIDIGNAVEMEKLLHRVARETSATILGSMKHQFEPDGSTAILLLSESHLSIHTWPEKKEAHIDYYHCGNDVKERLEKAVDLFMSYLPGNYKYFMVER